MNALCVTYSNQVKSTHSLCLSPLRDESENNPIKSEHSELDAGQRHDSRGRLGAMRRDDRRVHAGLVPLPVLVRGGLLLQPRFGRPHRQRLVHRRAGLGRPQEALVQPTVDGFGRVRHPLHRRLGARVLIRHLWNSHRKQG